MPLQLSEEYLEYTAHIRVIDRDGNHEVTKIIRIQPQEDPDNNDTVAAFKALDLAHEIPGFTGFVSVSCNS